MSLRYLNEFSQTKCAADLLALKLFPNVKEISESFGAYNAVRRHLWKTFQPHNADCHMVAVGDGVSPRTAATFAFRTAWQCHSVDPKLRGGKWYNPIRRNKLQRVTLWTMPVEKMVSWKPVEHLVIVAVHSHADLREAVRALPAKHVGVVAIECCVPQELDRAPDIQYEDFGILSPKRTVKVWK